ncbi:MAG: GH116 family glycosyl-hydrolase [Acidobacteriota bacterium]
MRKSLKSQNPKLGAGKIDRRAFLSELGAASAVAAVGKGASAGSKAGVGPALPTPAHSGPPPLTLHEPSHSYSGIPLGGIGAGSIEIKPDGTFQDWLIFNMGEWDPWKPAGQTQWPAPHITDHSLAFFSWAKREGEGPVVRRLDLDGHQQDLYSLGWAQCVEGIEFTGEFPRAQLEYRDDTLPVKVRSTFFSPFVPHDARLSGTPGFHGIFAITNPGKQPVEFSLMASLHNPLASGAPTNAARKLSNKVLVEGQTSWLTMQTSAQLQQRETVGSLALSFTGGQPSYIVEDFGRYVGNGGWLHGSLGATFQSFLVPFRQSGRLPSLPGAGCPASLLQMDDEQINALTEQQASELIATLGRTPSLKSIIDMGSREKRRKFPWLSRGIFLITSALADRNWATSTSTGSPMPSR